ncbi:hypothetical protein OHA21_12490 [Actinoplanes sp. NBC_00393]|uniref:hypothetical protein n=1 Tax=Actinoplanes sp. NBC_00393 TaxID=2975953 RepID=UPI002E244A02
MSRLPYFGGAQYDFGYPMLGPFHTIGVFAWLLAPLAALAGFGRWRSPPRSR